MPLFYSLMKAYGVFLYVPKWFLAKFFVISGLISGYDVGPDSFDVYRDVI